MDRRDTTRRAELVRSVVDGVVRNPYAVVTTESLEEWLRIPHPVAERILARLVAAGLIHKTDAGVWTRSRSEGTHMTDDKKPDTPKGPTLEERARIFEREILNAFTVDRNTSLADGAGAPGSTAAGNNRSGLHDADEQRGKRD